MVLMMMLRATLLALALLSTSAFKFVSQTFRGEYEDKSSDPYGSPTTHTVEFGLDMESVKFRTNHHMVGKIGKTNTSFDAKVSMIFDAEAKRVTTWTDTGIAALSSSPTPECMYSEFPSLPAPADVAKCLQGFVADAKCLQSACRCRKLRPTSEDGPQKVQIPILRKFPYSAQTFVCTDDVFVIQKIIADLHQQGADGKPIYAELTDMNAEAGAPDSSVFAVPKEWGNCTKVNSVFLGLNDINPVMRAFWKCMERAPIVV